MNRYDILLRKIPPSPTGVPESESIKGMRKKLLSNKFPFEVIDAVIREDLNDSTVFHIDMLIQPPPVPIKSFSMRMITTEKGWRFVDTSMVASPVNSNAAINTTPWSSDLYPSD